MTGSNLLPTLKTDLKKKREKQKGKERGKIGYFWVEDAEKCLVPAVVG